MSGVSRIFRISDLRLLTSLVCVLIFAVSPARADVDPTNIPAGAESWLKSFFWLSGSVAGIAISWKQLFPKRQPPIEQEFVSKDDLEKFCASRHQPVGDTLQEIKTQLRGYELKREEADAAHEARAKLIHGRINRLVPVIYTIAGRLNINVTSEPEEG